MDIIIGQIYRHFKGNLYKTLMLAEHSETGEQMVVYQALYGENKVYVRPKDMFVEVLDRTKYPDASQTYRFEMWGDAGKTLSAVQHTDAGPVTESVSLFAPEGPGTQLPEPPADGEKEAQPTVPPADNDKTAQTPPNSIDSQLEAFLDTKDFSEKLRILQGMKNIVTDPAIDTMAFSLDLELNEGSTEERYKELLSCVMVRERFENSRLRQ